jgi:hypothetical protein
MKRNLFWLSPLLALALVVLLPTRADARRGGFFLITHGDCVKRLGSVKAEMRDKVREFTKTQEVPDVGYLYSGAGVFWLDVWTWDGKYCLFSGKTCWELEPEQAAELMGVAPNQLSKPFVYSVPPGLGILLAGAAVWLIAKQRKAAKLQATKEQVLELKDKPEPPNPDAVQQP